MEATGASNARKSGCVLLLAVTGVFRLPPWECGIRAAFSV